MESVTVRRTVDAGPDAVREAMGDLEPFMAAAGFDGVVVEGDAVHLTNGVGIAEIELTVELVETDADLASPTSNARASSTRCSHRTPSRTPPTGAR